jgi:CHAT domain-containing protein/tetratricopeptide (TPR) repeat protein
MTAEEIPPEHLETFERVAAFIAQPRHLDTAETAELMWELRGCLLEHASAILRTFERRSKFSTYLAVILARYSERKKLIGSREIQSTGLSHESSGSAICPSDEAMALLVEGKFGRAARREVIEHMDHCGECRPVFLMASAFAAHASSKASSAKFYLSAAAAIAAALAIALAGPPIRQTVFPPTVGIAELVQASEGISHRRAAGRLSGNFDHRELRSAERERQDLRLEAARAAIATLAHRNATTENLHAFGVANVLLGTNEEAVKALTRALHRETGKRDLGHAIAASTDAPLLNDLAVAVHAHAREKQLPERYLIAFEAAARAWKLKPSPEAAFNRALALEDLGLKEDAREAWDAYLRIDPSSAWSVEVRERRLKDERRDDPGRWEDRIPDLERAVIAGADGMIARLVEAYPQQARMWAEHKRLPLWANAYLHANEGDARARLAECRAVGNVLAHKSHEFMLLDDVATIDALLQRGDTKRLERYAIALRDFGKARTHYEERRISEARTAFHAAAALLMQAGSSLAHAARLYEISCEYYENRFDKVRVDAGAVLSRNSLDRYPSTLAQIYWLRGLGNLNTGRPQAALVDYSDALRLFERLGETENALAIHEAIAGVYTFIGEHEAAFRHRRRALELLPRNPSIPRHLVILIGIAKSALRVGAPNAALVTLNRQLRQSVDPRFAELRANALLWRSRVYDQLNDDKSASGDIKDARAVVERVVDQSIRNYARHSVEFVFEEAAAAQSARERHKVIDEALAFAQATKQEYRMSQLYLLKGETYEQEGDVRAAEAAFLDSARVVEQQRGLLADDELRSQFFNERKDVYDKLLRLYAERGDSSSAFDIAERARARTLLDRVSGVREGTPSLLPLADVQRNLPPDVVLFEYAVLDDRLLIWVVSKATVDYREVPIRGADLSRLVTTLSSAIHDDDESRARAASEKLFEYVVRPGLPSVPPASSIVFVPDQEMALIPFAALRDAQQHRYVIEMAPVSVAPSANVLVQCLVNGRRVTPSAVYDVLLIAPDTPDDMPALRAVSREIDAVRRMYDRVTVLAGEAATKSAVLTEAPLAKIVHFGGHGISDATGKDSRLVLSRDSSDRENLFAEDLRQFRFRATRLVVLASCEGALDSAENRQGVTNLARAFLAAGVPTVVANLRAVDDEVAAALIKRFHENIAHGEGPWDAMRSAQLSMLQSHLEQYRNISSWSGFVVIGSGEM